MVNVDTKKGLKSLLKGILYLNIIFFISIIFIEIDKNTLLVMFGSNILLILLRIGMENKEEDINYISNKY